MEAGKPSAFATLFAPPSGRIVQPMPVPAKVLNALATVPSPPATTTNVIVVEGLWRRQSLLLLQIDRNKTARFGSTDKILGRHIA